MRFLIIVTVIFAISFECTAQKKEIAVIAYYSGNAAGIDQFDVKKLTHIIYSFCHLKGNKLSVDNANDTATIRKLVSMKQKNPQLKVLLSLGGWGGCQTCSPVFATEKGREEFAQSVKDLGNYFKTDGIDLDWEYPAIEGYPGHQYLKEDKDNFTDLIVRLRKHLGKEHVISFAAGGFTRFLYESVDWKKIMPIVDFVNLMSYDLVHGYSTVTGHHTPLYSNKEQVESADHAIVMLDSLKVPLNKVIIGAAFYARTWINVEPVNNGIYQSGKFKDFISFRQFDQVLSKDSGYVFYYDETAKATHAYNASKKIFATFDNPESVKEKTNYVVSKGLGGIMFWELSLDTPSKGMLDAIYEKKLFLSK